MKFRFVSDQFSFAEGDVFIVSPHPVIRPVGEARLRENVIAYDGALSAGIVVLTLANVSVTSRVSGSSRRVDLMIVRVSLSDDDTRRDETEVEMGSHAIVRVQVVGEILEGNSKPKVGFYGDPMLVKLVNDHGYLDVLLPAGLNKVYLDALPSVKASFQIAEGQEDGGVVELRGDAPRAP